ncbi:alpha/beta fold hydrolase [Kitasatospora sp. NPDC052896]|uniref:alpha/beta fold hydrolase n=1 Tax=Kitasatospora sp. NPDC052896 TaxID=3364061 RepID=UPI0037C5026A
MTQQRLVEVNGLEIAYRQSSGEEGQVVLVHGNSASSRTWQQLLDGPFGKRFRCLALDLPGHGASARAATADAYSLPFYAGALAGFARAVGATGALLVGWSLGGHIALEAAPLLPDAAGLAVFGTPPMSTPAAMGEAFLPHPAMSVGFSEQVGPDEARAYAASQLAPGSALPLDAAAQDILATAPAARAGLAASLAAGAFADELAIARAMPQPLAILHGSEEQLVNLAYLRSLELPRLWRGAVQLIDGSGHAPQEERPAEFAALLTEFAAELPALRR